MPKPSYGTNHAVNLDGYRALAIKTNGKLSLYPESRKYPLRLHKGRPMTQRATWDESGLAKTSRPQALNNNRLILVTISFK